MTVELTYRQKTLQPRRLQKLNLGDAVSLRIRFCRNRRNGNCPDRLSHLKPKGQSQGKGKLPPLWSHYPFGGEEAGGPNPAFFPSFRPVGLGEAKLFGDQLAGIGSMFNRKPTALKILVSVSIVGLPFSLSTLKSVLSPTSARLATVAMPWALAICRRASKSVG